MKQSERERLLLIDNCMDDADVPKYAKVDVRNRLETKFAEQDWVEKWEIDDQLNVWKRDKDSQWLWGQPETKATPKEPPVDWSKLPPAERMTAFRQQQEAQQKH